MAVNVTQKDATLHKVIEWLDGQADEAHAAIERYGDLDYDRGRFAAFRHAIGHCRDMLGYSGSMPLEVPNQSKDGGR